MNKAELLAVLVSVISAVIALLALLEAKKVKATDLRLDLNKAHNDIDLELRDLPGFVAHVGQSHERVSAMRGLRSGALEHIEGQETLGDLMSGAPKREDFSGLSGVQLEARIVAAHAFLGRARRLRGRYQAILDEDDEHRRERRAEMSSRGPVRG